MQDGRQSGVDRYGRYESAGKMVMNDNKGINNILPDDQLVPTIVETLDDIITLLKRHCGPDSEYAMIVTGSGNADFEPNIFTKDGIKILSHLEYVSPIQTYVKELIAYIGRRVDSAAKDGTTTSMLIAAMFLRRMLVEDYAYIKYMPTVIVEQAYADTVSAIDVVIDTEVEDTTLVSTVDTICGMGFREDEAAGVIAFTQALSSSGRNMELACVNYELFKNTPKELWNRITMTQSTIETDTPYSVRYQESQYKLAVTMATEIRNRDLGTRYVEENVRCFVYPDAISAGTTVLDRVINLLNEAPENIPLAIVAQEIDAHLVQYAFKLNKTRATPITMYINMEKSKYGKDCWDLMAINAMAGVPSYTNREESLDAIDINKHCILVKQLEVNYNNLELFDFYTVEDPTCNLHPYYSNPDKYRPYTELLNDLNSVIARDVTAHIHNASLVDNAYRVISQMVCRRVPQLVIGGSTHENIANMAVAQDVIGATMSSIQHGFIMGGILAIAVRLRILLKLAHDHPLKSGSQLLLTLLTCIEHVTELVYIPYKGMGLYVANKELSYSDLYLDTEYSNFIKEYIDGYRYRELLATATEHIPFNEAVSKVRDYMQVFKDTEVGSEEFLTRISVLGYPPIQPVKLYSEMFDRIGELLLKVIKSKSIMVPGGVFLSEPK